MNLPSSSKIYFGLGIAALSLIGLANLPLDTQQKSQQQTLQPQSGENLSFIQSDNPVLAPLQNYSATNSASSTDKISQNYLNNQTNSDDTIGKQNISSYGKYLALASTPYQVIDEWKKYKFSISGSQILAPTKLPTTKVNFNQADLLTVLINTRKYFQTYSSEDPDIQRSGLLTTQGVTVQDILKTLDFMITVLQEDIANNRTTRLQDPKFINTHFRVIKWNAYNPKIKSQKQLRLTKYAVFIHSGSRTKTSTYNIPLYSLKGNSTTDKFYTRYTKQDVLSGIYEPGGREFGKVEPLAYLTRTGLEEALMQGTILINFTDGSKAFFNVDRNNGMSYIRGLKATAQKRYWYFRKVDAIKGYGYKIDAKISIKPGVTFAGDVLNIGLGRVVIIENNQGGSKYLRMGVIADTGGAFLPNLYQLDFLAGIFPNQKAFGNYISQLPEYATAYFLVKK